MKTFQRDLPDRVDDRGCHYRYSGGHRDSPVQRVPEKGEDKAAQSDAKNLLTQAVANSTN